MNLSTFDREANYWFYFYILQNRGRLASKCSLSPTSPRKRRDSFKSSPAWQTDGSVDPIVSHRHFSASDLDHFHSSSKNGLPELSSSRESSSSTSDCSEPADESPFSPVNKRARSSSPENFEKSAAINRRRRSDSSHALCLNTGTVSINVVLKVFLSFNFFPIALAPQIRF